MAVSMFEQARYEKTRRNFLIFLGACIAFSSVIYMPVYWLMYSDVVWNESIPMLIWMEMVEPLMNYAFYLGSFAFVIWGAARFGTRKVRAFVALYAGAALLRYLTNVLSYMWVMGAIHFSEWAAYDFPEILFSTGIDCLQMAIVFAACYGTLNNRKYEPVTRITAYATPMLRVAWVSAVLPALTQLASRIYYDLQLVLSFNNRIGRGEVFLMILYYVIDLCAIPVGFLALSLVLRRLSRSEQAALDAYNEAKQTRK